MTQRELLTASHKQIDTQPESEQQLPQKTNTVHLFFFFFKLLSMMLYTMSYLSGRGQSEKQRNHWCCLSTVPNINNIDLILINDDKTLVCYQLI